MSTLKPDSINIEARLDRTGLITMVTVWRKPALIVQLEKYDARLGSPTIKMISMLKLSLT